MSSLKSSYRILPNDNLVIEYHTGTLEIDLYIDFKKNMLKDPHFKANLNHYIYYKDVIFKTPPPDIVKYVDFVKTNVKSFGHRKIALITNTPNQVVSTTMYKMMVKNSNQIVEVFSTNQTAINWLNPPQLKIDKLINILLGLMKL